MSAYVTREIIDTAARAEWDHYRPDLDGGPWEGLTEAQRASWREGVEVVLAAALPLVTPAIKAEALREAAIQANGPRLEESGGNSSLRDRIAQAIAGADSGTLHGVRPCAACQAGDTNQPCDDCLIMADAVIAVLGLTEELGSRSHGTGLMDCGVTPGPDILGRHNHRRWVTDWKETP